MTIPIQGNAYGPISQSEVQVQGGTGAKRPAQFTDEAALKLCVQDAALAEQWMDQRQWSLDWREIDILYQSPRTNATFENSTARRANVSRFTVAKHTNTLAPAVVQGIFYDSPPFVLRPRPGTSQDTTRAKTALFSYLLDEMGFETECELGIESQVCKGTGFWKWGWYVENTIQKKYVRKKHPTTVTMPLGDTHTVDTEESDEFEVKEITVKKSRPFFEYVPLGELLVDPGWRRPNEVWRAGYVVHRQYLTFHDLEKLRDTEGYDIPATDELKKMLWPDQGESAIAPSSVERAATQNVTIHHADGRDQKTTNDPLAQTFKVDERWDSDRVICVVQDKFLIRNEDHTMGRITFLSANWWNIEKSGYGMGIGKLVGGDQRLEQGVTNAAVDMVSFGVNPTFVRARGSNAATQQIRSRLGGVIEVDIPSGARSVKDALGILEMPTVPAEAWATIANAKQSSESVSGADEAFVQGKLPERGGSSAARTATGAAGIAAASAGRIQGPVGKFVKNVFIPFIRHLDEMVKERMPLSEVRAILKDRLGEDFKLDAEQWFNAEIEYEVLAGAHLAAKKAMAQSLPWMIQILENPHMLESLNATRWTVDIKEIFAMVMEVSEWKNTRTLIRPLTPEEKKAYANVKNPQQQKLEGDMQKMQLKGQIDSAHIDQKAEARLASTLTEQAMDRAAGYEERRAMEREIEPRAQGTAQYSTTGA